MLIDAGCCVDAFGFGGIFGFFFSGFGISGTDYNIACAESPSVGRIDVIPPSSSA